MVVESCVVMVGTQVLAMQAERTGGIPLAGQTGEAAPAAAPGAGGTQQAPPPSLFGGGWFLPIMLGLLFLLMFSPMMSQRKERKRQRQMLSSLDRHDKVLTVGGIIGTIADVRDDEITLKVDDSTNTRIKFSRSSVQQVLKKSGGGGGEATIETKPQKQKATV